MATKKTIRFKDWQLWADYGAGWQYETSAKDNETIWKRCKEHKEWFPAVKRQVRHELVVLRHAV